MTAVDLGSITCFVKKHSFVCDFNDYYLNGLAFISSLAIIFKANGEQTTVVKSQIKFREIFLGPLIQVKTLSLWSAIGNQFPVNRTIQNISVLVQADKVTSPQCCQKGEGADLSPEGSGPSENVCITGDWTQHCVSVCMCISLTLLYPMHITWHSSPICLQ